MANPNPNQTFLDMLTNSCNLNTPAMRDAIVVEQGVTTITELEQLSLKEIEVMVQSINKTVRRANQRFIISTLSMKYLKAARVWCKWQRAKGHVPVAEEFNADARTRTLRRMEQEELISDADAPTPTAPPKLMHNGSKYWIPFWKQFSAYCSQIRGTLKIPLSYVYREHVDVTPEIAAAVYESDDDYLCAVVVLNGKYYDKDNRAVWDLLVPLINTGDAWSFVKRFEATKDGRRAIEELRRISEGSAANTALKAAAKASLRTLTYNGRSKNFTFDQFIAKMNEAFTQLATAGDPYSENNKVHTLLEAVRGVDTLGNVVTHIMGNEAMLNNFTMAVTYMQSMVSLYRSYDSSTTSRNVSAATTSNNDSDLKQSYSREEWKKLSQDVKDRVIKRNKENKSKANSKPSMKSLKRKVKALTKENEKLKDDNGSIEADSGETDTTSQASTAKVSNKKKN